MKDIRIPKESITRDELLASVQAAIPDAKFEVRGNSRFKISRGKGAAMVKVRSRSVGIDQRFPSKGGQLGWVLSLVFLGVILPLIFYGVTRRKAMKKLENEVAAVVKALGGSVKAEEDPSTSKDDEFRPPNKDED